MIAITEPHSMLAVKSAVAADSIDYALHRPSIRDRLRISHNPSVALLLLDISLLCIVYSIPFQPRSKLYPLATRGLLLRIAIRRDSTLVGDGRRDQHSRLYSVGFIDDG